MVSTAKQPNGEHRQRSTVPVETWTTPVEPFVHVDVAHEAGEVATRPRIHRQLQRWYMSDITENTRVVIKVGSIAAVAVVILLAGSWWGGLQSERTQVQAAVAAQHATDARQDDDIRQLRDTIAAINTNLALIKQGQEQSLPTLGRNSQYSIELLRDLETALAKRGIETEKHGP
jgi:hypothetical protein